MIENQKSLSHQEGSFERTLNLLIRVGLILGLAVWCFLILQPFLMIVLWGMIIAVSVHPLYRWLKKRFGDKSLWASIVVTAIIMLIILVPFFLLAKTMYDGILSLKEVLDAENYSIPPPDISVKSWPVIGGIVYKYWLHASQNLGAVVTEFQPQIKAFLTWLIKAAKDTGVGVVKFLISIVVSGVFLALSEQGGTFAHELSKRLAGRRGDEFAEAAGITIRSVARGILGVAFIQAGLAGLGFLVAGVPGAGLWALVALFLGIVQIGILPVCLVVVIYMFFHAPTLTAVALMIWCILIGPLDNILKPIMLGRGSRSPMLVIFLGSIGGFLLSGIIGLFVGAVILSLGYNLFMIWLRDKNESEPATAS